MYDAGAGLFKTEVELGLLRVVTWGPVISGGEWIQKTEISFFTSL